MFQSINSFVLVCTMSIFASVSAQDVVQGEQIYSTAGGDVWPGHVEFTTTPNEMVTTGVFAPGGVMPYTNAANQPRIYLNTYNTTASSPLSAVTKRSYLTCTEASAGTINAGRSYISRDVKALVAGGYIVCGEVSDVALTPQKRGFLMKTDAAGNVLWFRHYYPNNNNMDEIGFNAVDMMASSQGGFVVVGYRVDKTVNRKIARLVELDASGNVTATRELNNSTTAASEYIDVVQLGNDMFVVTGSCNVFYNSSNVKIASDVVMTVFNATTNAIGSHSYKVPAPATLDGKVEEGRAIVKYGTNVAIVGKKYTESLNATQATFANQSILAVSFTVTTTGTPSTLIGGAWTNNSKTLDITGIADENPKDLIYGGTTSGALNFWTVGLANGGAFLLNLNNTGTVPGGNAELYQSAAGSLTGECLSKSTAGNIIFAGRSSFSGSQSADLVARIGGTTTTGGTCAATLNTVTETVQSLTRAALTNATPTTTTTTECHIAVMHGNTVAYPCPGIVPALRTSADNTTGSIAEIGQTFTVNIYPNPFQTTLNIQYTLSTDSEVSFNMYDLSGKKVLSYTSTEVETSGEKELSFDTNELPAGIYVWKMQTAEKALTGKLIKTE